MDLDRERLRNVPVCLKLFQPDISCGWLAQEDPYRIAERFVFRVRLRFHARRFNQSMLTGSVFGPRAI
jgi:hypothetical protein